MAGAAQDGSAEDGVGEDSQGEDGLGEDGPGEDNTADAGAAREELAVGLRATVTAEVTDADTAVALGSGDVPVLGTPRLLALAEAASVAAVAPALTAGQTTVGTEVSLEHSRPTPVGAPVAVAAELTGIVGRRLTFSFIAYSPRDGGDADHGASRSASPGASPAEDDALVIGAGEVQRVIVDRAAFLATAARS